MYFAILSSAACYNNNNISRNRKEEKSTEVITIDIFDYILIIKNLQNSNVILLININVYNLVALLLLLLFYSYADNIERKLKQSIL